MRPLLLIGCAGSIACAPNPFVCVDDTQCVDGERTGVCQPSGFCSFPDPSCPSGQRYGAHAGAGLVHACVADDPDVADGSETSQGTTTTTGATSMTNASGDTTVASADSADASEGSSTGAELLDPDLVAWYRFDDPLADGAEDSSLNGLHASCDVCPMSTFGIHGQAAAFDGEATFFELPASPLFELTQALTVAAWARVDAWPPGVQAVVGRPVGDGFQNSWELFAWVAQSGTAYRFFGRLADDLDTPADVSVLLPRPSLDWHHLALTWDGAMIRLYVDGASVDEAEASEVLYDRQLGRIGADFDHGEVSNHLLGAVDDVRIYRRALEADEIAELALRP